MIRFFRALDAPVKIGSALEKGGAPEEDGGAHGRGCGDEEKTAEKTVEADEPERREEKSEAAPTVEVVEIKDEGRGDREGRQRGRLRRSG